MRGAKRRARKPKIAGLERGPSSLRFMILILGKTVSGWRGGERSSGRNSFRDSMPAPPDEGASRGCDRRVPFFADAERRPEHEAYRTRWLRCRSRGVAPFPPPGPGLFLRKKSVAPSSSARLLGCSPRRQRFRCHGRMALWPCPIPTVADGSNGSMIAMGPGCDGVSDPASRVSGRI